MDESDPLFLSLSQKASHHQTYKKFLQHTKSQNYLFVNYKYTSPLNMTHFYTIDHTRILTMTHHDHLLYLKITSNIHFDDFLLPCNIPTYIVKPLTVIKHLVPSLLDDKDKLYYTTLAKQSYSYNELLFISAKTISYIVQTEQKTEHKPPFIEHTSPIRNTPEKLSSVLNNHTLRDITHLLDPCKRNSSDSLITTLTHIIHC